MRKIYKINKLIFNLSLLCIFIPSLAAAVSSTSNFTIKNAAHYNLTVKNVIHPYGLIKVNFSTPPPEHWIFQTHQDTVTIKTENVEYKAEQAIIVYGISQDPGTCMITFQSAYYKKRGGGLPSLLMPAQIVSTQNASSYFRCEFSGSTVTFK